MVEQETTAVESEDDFKVMDIEPVDKMPGCPMIKHRPDPPSRWTCECIASDCAWWVEGRGKKREAGCSMRVLAEACSELIIKVRLGKLSGR